MTSSGRKMFLRLLLAIIFFGIIVAEEEIINPTATSDMEATGNMDNDYTESPEDMGSTDDMDYDDADSAGGIDASDVIDSTDDMDVADSNVPTDNVDSTEGMDSTHDTDSNADFYFTSDIDLIENTESSDETDLSDMYSTSDMDSIENPESTDDSETPDIDSLDDIDSVENTKSSNETDSSDMYSTSDMDSTGDIDSFEEAESADEIDSTDEIDSVENIEPTDESESADIDSTGDIEQADSSDTTDDSDIVELVDSTGDIDSTDKGDLRADIEIDTDTEDQDEGLTPNGFSKKRMQRFCARVLKGSEPIDTHTCRYVTCDRNGYKTGAHVFNANICPVGQFCDDGTCLPMAPERPKEALTNEEWKIVNAECKKKFGKRFGPYCSHTNIATHLDIASNCKNDLCDAMLCAGIKHRRVRFSWAYLDVGSKCELKKSCNKYRQCEIDDWVESP